MLIASMGLNYGTRENISTGAIGYWLPIYFLLFEIHEESNM